ncbi:hypothetical protein [Aquimarina mytili]|uniref:Uncharacterized protein n=1 Tax=Aquimarina mytili TaxID=874423 RepID=A0A937A3D4_9FLAO|nr:hypothetical protein [Aquimarina mytili]MBL0686131.1 hypothetical protein [Aquimarina mytili]
MLGFTLSDLEVSLDFNFKNTKEESRINQFVKIIGNFNVADAENYFDEEYEDSMKMNQYNILAALNQVLEKFKSEGDTKLYMKRGSCKKLCFEGQDQLYQLVGNNSGHTFDFGIIEKDNKIVDFHGCMGFFDCNGNPSTKYQTMCVTYALKLAEMSK